MFWGEVSRGEEGTQYNIISNPANTLALLLRSFDHSIAGNDAFFELVEPALKRVVMATGNQAQVRAAGLRAWSLAAFICSTDFPSTIVLLDLCEAAANERYRGEDSSPLLRAAALDSWSLLATTIEDTDIASEEVRREFIARVNTREEHQKNLTPNFRRDEDRPFCPCCRRRWTATRQS